MSRALASERHRKNRWGVLAIAVVLVSATTTSEARAQGTYDRPWLRTDAVLVLDPYEANAIDWDAVAHDTKVKGILHRASIGGRTDRQFVARAAEARRHGLLWGGYHLGLVGDPRAQADLLLSLASQTGTQLLALDIEGIVGNNMQLPDAEVFVRRIHEKTGRYLLPLAIAQRLTHKQGCNLLVHCDNERCDVLMLARTVLAIGRLCSPTEMPDRTSWQPGPPEISRGLAQPKDTWRARACNYAAATLEGMVPIQVGV